MADTSPDENEASGTPDQKTKKPSGNLKSIQAKLTY